MDGINPRWIPLFAALVSSCGPAPIAPTAAAPAADGGTARKAVSAALTALLHRGFDVGGCNAADARIVPEAAARAAAAPGERCSMAVAHQADGAWLVVVGSALSSKSYGARALVTVAAQGEGVRTIDYAK